MRIELIHSNTHLLVQSYVDTYDKIMDNPCLEYM